MILYSQAQYFDSLHSSTLKTTTPPGNVVKLPNFLITMQYDIHSIASALDAKSTGMGLYNAYCPVCQADQKERRKSRKLGLKQGRKGFPVYNCWRGCTYEDIRNSIDAIMKNYISVDKTPRVFTATVNTQDEEDERRNNILKCIAENAKSGNSVPAVRNYAKRLGFSYIPHNWNYAERILGYEGLNIPEPSKPSLIVTCVDKHNKPIAGQRILIYDNGERITNYAKVKFSKFTFGFIRGNPYNTTLLPTATTKALLVTESAETAAVIHEATDGSETWAVFGVSNFMTIPLVERNIPRKRPIIFFPDLDAINSAAHSAFERALNHHARNGYSCFTIIPPGDLGSGDNFTDYCQRNGIEEVREYINSSIDELRNQSRGNT